ncbi:MAG: hypothetical protein JXB32_01175 [Deltaproteobacteria bacterium]|nr:hypothetical protein [Deltaproteobacteria bacterium]
MRKIVVPMVALAVLGAVVGLTVAGGGCKDDSCTKDTDCEMPYVCIRSACVPVGTVFDVPVTDVPDVPEDDADVPPTDDTGPDGDADDGPIDVPVDGDAPDDGDEDDSGGCRPVTSAPFNIVATAADGDERPVSLRSGAGFVFFGRPPGLAAADGLRFQRLNLDGTAASAAMWTLSSVEISPFHPIVELPSGSFATAFEVLESTGPGIWLKVLASSGTGGEVPVRVPDTTAASSEPSITYDGTDLIVVWTHTDSGTVEVRGQHFNAATGVAIGSPVTLAAGPSGTKEPRILWGDTRHTLVYFDASDGALHVLALDGTLVEQAEHVIPPPSGHSFIGYPALAWNGTEFGLAWETRGTVSAELHLATFMPGAEPVEHDVLSDVPLSGTELGQVALAWGDLTGEWGLAWRYTQTSRVGIALARIDATDFHTIEGPVDIRPGSTTAWHPSLAYNSGFYMASWIEQATEPTPYPIYEATHGCTP